MKYIKKMIITNSLEQGEYAIGKKRWGVFYGKELCATFPSYSEAKRVYLSGSPMSRWWNLQEDGSFKLNDGSNITVKIIESK